MVGTACCRRGHVCAMVLSAITMMALIPTAWSQEAPPGWDVVYDFLVQDVCTNASGSVLKNVSPLDPTDKCPNHRNLHKGEPLPYHKHDWANASERSGRPNGYERSDSFPVPTRLFSTVVVQTFDFGGGERKFGQFDEGHGDGGQIVVFSPDSVAFGMTEDGSGGIQFFYGPKCSEQDNALRIIDSWIVVDKTFSIDRAGETLAHLTRNPHFCSKALDFSFTRWHVKPVGFRRRIDGKETVKSLTTLISDHFGGKSPDEADHLERFYFTRELGLTSWERWQNLRRAEKPSYRPQAAALATSARCAHAAEAPASSGEWLLIDCREWTNIVPADHAVGDSPDFWIKEVRSRAETQRWFAD